MSRRRAGLGAACAAAAAVALAGAARADLYRCTGPDGRTVYTDDKSVCPAAETYRPGAEIHSVDPSGGAATTSPAARRAAPVQDAASADAQRWRALKATSQDELSDVARERKYLGQYVKLCNRGGQVLYRDEAGIKRTMSCDVLSSRHATLEARETELRDYLDHGLADECRRAGCLPGWIR